MSVKVMKENGSEKVPTSHKFNQFVTKNRAVFITVLISVTCVILALVAFTLVTENKNTVAFEVVESVVTDWEGARAGPDQSGLATKEDELIAKLTKVASSNKKSYAGSRAYMTIAEIYFSRKDWKNAQEQYLFAAKAAPRAYTTGLNYYNAGICADELGSSDDAITYLTKAFEAENFALKARTLFNIGRIEEQRSNKEAAIVAYEKMAEKYPDDEWTLIAKSRIIALQIK